MGVGAVSVNCHPAISDPAGTLFKSKLPRRTSMDTGSQLAHGHDIATKVALMFQKRAKLAQGRC